MMEVSAFQALDRWDGYTVPPLHFPGRASRQAIGSLLRRRIEPVNMRDHSFGSLQPITIHFNGLVSKRAVKKDRQYKMALFRARPSDLVLSKIDLKNGAVGVLPSDWDNAVVTSHFAIYEPDIERLHPIFLRYLVQTANFKRWLWANRSGADGRTEVKLPIFEGLEIALPSIAEQQAAVTAHDAALTAAAAKEQAADVAETEAVASFEVALGFAPAASLPDRPVFIASFQGLDRWSHDGALRAAHGGGAGSTCWPVARLGDLIDDITVGWSPKCLDRPASVGGWGVLKLSAITSGTLRSDENKALLPSMPPRPDLAIREGDVLIARGSGVTRLVGSTALVDGVPSSNLMICDLIFRVAFGHSSQLSPAFLVEVLRTPQLRYQIESRRTGAAPMMQKITKPGLRSLTFPLPPPAIQAALVAALDAGRAIAARLRAEAATARTAARLAFEASVYDAALADVPGQVVA